MTSLTTKKYHFFDASSNTYEYKDLPVVMGIDYMFSWGIDTFFSSLHENVYLLILSFFLHYKLPK